MSRLGIIQQITINIMLHNEPRRIEPVVKDLATHDMPAHAPAVLVSLVPEPVVAEDLGVEIVCLEGRVMDVVLGALEEEEDVVVDELLAAVEAVEDGDILAVGGVDELLR